LFFWLWPLAFAFASEQKSDNSSFFILKNKKHLSSERKKRLMPLVVGRVGVQREQREQKEAFEQPK
jgi:hypothetical protein